MWINPMLTIFVWSVLFSLIVIVFCLWKWYFSEPPTKGEVRTSDEQHASGSGTSS